MLSLGLEEEVRMPATSSISGAALNGVRSKQISLIADGRTVYTFKPGPYGSETLGGWQIQDQEVVFLGVHAAEGTIYNISSFKLFPVAGAGRQVR